MKFLLLTLIVSLSFNTITIAQTVPSYLPTSGLVGWWPFNGNADDESGNGNHGIVNGSTLTSDQAGIINSAYDFDKSDSNFIEIFENSSLNPTTGITISSWIYLNQHVENQNFVSKAFTSCSLPYISYSLKMGDDFVQLHLSINGVRHFIQSKEILPLQQWFFITGTYDGQNMKLFINGILNNSNSVSGNITNYTSNLNFGRWSIGTSCNNPQYLDGKLDDIGIWNRALTQQEITNLYNRCQLTVSSQPANQTVNISTTAQFTIQSSDPTVTYQWQTDIGIGFQNLNSVGQYSGTTNDTLTISYTTMSNHNQPFRCIISSGFCTDTSDVAVLTVVNNVSVNEFTEENLFSVFPNPANGSINVKVDSKLMGNVYTIFDITGKVVLSGKINSENSVIELGNLSAGMYIFNIGDNMNQSFKVIKE